MKRDAVVELHRAGEVVLHHAAEDEADQQRRQRVVGEAQDRRADAEADQDQQFGRVVLADIGAHQGEEQDERDQVVARHREHLGDVGDQRQVQDQQHQVADDTSR